MEGEGGKLEGVDGVEFTQGYENESIIFQHSHQTINLMRRIVEFAVARKAFSPCRSTEEGPNNPRRALN